MAISLIGQAGVAGGDQTSPQVISYTSTQGNTLILAGFLYNPNATVPGISTITDDANNTWLYSTSVSQNPPYEVDGFSSNESIQFVAWCINASAISALTVTMPNDGPWTRFALSEWSGIGAYDSSASAVSATGTNATAALTLSSANDLVICAIENNAGTSITPPAGFVEFTSSGTTPNVTYGFPGVSGSYSPSFLLGTSSDWGVAFAAFKPAGVSNPGAILGMFP